MATTKLDAMKLAAAEISERRRNIDSLNTQLAEAKTLLRAIPDDSSLTTQAERMAVNGRIKLLNDLIADEQRAINEVNAPADVDEIINSIC